MKFEIEDYIKEIDEDSNSKVYKIIDTVRENLRLNYTESYVLLDPQGNEIEYTKLWVEEHCNKINLSELEKELHFE